MENRLPFDMTPVQAKRFNGLVSILQKGGEIEDAAFLHSVLCQTFLPYKDPGKDVREYLKVQGNAHLLLKAGELFNPKTKTFEPVPLPFGPKARLVLAYINTIAIRTQNPVIPVEDSLTAFVKKLGLDTGGKTITAVKDQINRLAASTIRIGYSTSEDTALTGKLDIIDSLELWLGKDDKQKVMWPGTIKLSDKFHHSLMEHAIPLDERVLASLANNAMALDIYVWLAQRLHRISATKPQMITWKALEDQFGGTYSNSRKFRQNFRERLQLVLKFYQDAKIEETDRGLKLKNSPPPVQPEKKVFLPG
jgi:hypothetical protein